MVDTFAPSPSAHRTHSHKPHRYSAQKHTQIKQLVEKTTFNNHIFGVEVARCSTTGIHKTLFEDVVIKNREAVGKYDHKLLCHKTQCLTFFVCPLVVCTPDINAALAVVA